MYHGTIIQIDDCLVSEEILTEYFACDYQKCKGCCCIIGDSGAPMEQCEAEAIEKNYHIFSPLMSDKGRKAVAARGGKDFTDVDPFEKFQKKSKKWFPLKLSSETLSPSSSG